MNAKSNLEATGLQKFFLMKPLMVRTLIVAVTVIVARIVGASVDTALIDNFVELYTALSAVVLYFIGQGAVTANSKVVVKLEDPTDPMTAVNGEAAATVREAQAPVKTVTPEEEFDV